MKNVKCDIPPGLAGGSSKSKFEGEFVIDIPGIITTQNNSDTQVMYLTQSDNGYIVHYHSLSFAVSAEDAEQLKFLTIKEKPKSPNHC